MAHNVRVCVSCVQAHQGKGFCIHINNVYYDSEGRQHRYTDRSCRPNSLLEIGRKMYVLDSFIHYEPLSPYSTSPDVGHYVSYIRLSGHGDIWKVANDGDEQLRTWEQISDTTGYIYFYSE